MEDEHWKSYFEQGKYDANGVRPLFDGCIGDGEKTKTYNSGYLLVAIVTRLTTNLLVRCLNRAERTGSLIVSYLVEAI